MKIVIAGGMGFVGKEVSRLFPLALIYDPPQGAGLDICGKGKSHFDFCFICVPTPQSADGSCDTAYVGNALRKIKADVYICLSTIPPDMKLPDNVVFQPEYAASSSPYPAPLGDITKRPFIILGGHREAVKKARRLYESVYPPTVEIFETDSVTARIIKYMENSFIAMYVTFCNSFYDISEVFGVDYDDVIKGFLLDPRMTKYWTYISKQRGWGGHCLGKDTAAITAACEDEGFDFELMNCIRRINNEHRISGTVVENKSRSRG